MKQVGAVIAAAGLSSRMGDFKPLLPFGKACIAHHLVEMLKQAGVSPIVMVTGYRGEEENQQFIQAMCACLQVSGNETLQEVFVQKDPSQKSNYLLTFELVSHQDGSVLKPDGSNLKNPYYVRATNHSLVTLFVNVLNIDSSLNTYLVLQPDKQGHFANYLLPAESTVSFPQQTIEFSRMSTENFVLMAAPFPVDFSLLESPIHRQSEESKSKMKIGLSRLTFHLH